MHPFRTVARLLACALLLAGCGDDSRTAPTEPEVPVVPDSRVASITFKQPQITLLPGMSGPLTVVARDAEGKVVEGISFTWTTSDPTRATISANGVIASVSPGTAKITARYGSVSGEADVAVYSSASELPIHGVSLAQRALQFRRGSGAQLGATVYAVVLQQVNYTLTRPIAWSAADSSVLSVTRAQGSPESGPVIVGGTRAGTTYLIASAGGFRDSALVTVLGPPAEIVLTRSSAAVAVPDTLLFTATARDSLGQVYPVDLFGQVTWSSSDAAKASVRSYTRNVGQGFALAAGAPTITATAEGLTATMPLTVFAPVSSVEITPATATLAAGASTPFTAVGRDASGNVVPGRTFTWISSNLSLLAVSSSGVGTGRAGGTARVTATSNGKAGSATITVTGPPPAAASVWREISAGVTHSCAIDSSSDLYCWGANDEGQLGDGTHTASDVPRLVSGGRKYARVRLGQARSCATATNGDTYCWGGMYEAASDVPLRVNAPSLLFGLAMGNTFACALTEADAAVCWGSGTRTASRDPVAVPNAGTFIGVTGTNYGGCGVRSTGAVLCWTGLGFSSNQIASEGVETVEGSGTLGFVCGRANGIVNCSHTSDTGGPGGQMVNRGFGPLAGSPSGVKQISVGGGQVCALDPAGAAYCWTRRHASSSGSSQTYTFGQPARVAEGFTFTQISVGDKHVCGLAANGQGYCWGSNASGQLGAGFTGGESNGPSPVTRP